MKREFMVQLHITDQCENDCGYCYLKGKESGQISLDKYKILIDQFLEHILSLEKITETSLSPVLHLTGGDPLLHSNILDFVRIASERGVEVGILGNPTDNLLLLNQLSHAGLKSFQISVDGLLSEHSRHRYTSIGEVVSFIDRINFIGMKSYVAYNVTEGNLDELVASYDFLNKEVKPTSFIFSRVIHEDVDLIDSERYRDKLHELNRFVKGLRDSGEYNTQLVLKDPLWSLVKRESGELEPSDEFIHGGCNVGIDFLAIDYDGDCYACRRLPIIIGNVFESSIHEIFMNSNFLNSVRERNNHECCDCEVYNHCRGCIAMSYLKKHNIYFKDPQCWRNDGKADKEHGRVLEKSGHLQ